MRNCLGAVVGTMLALASVAHAGAPITIMPLGDSITAGTVPGGYRKPMVEKLEHDTGLSVVTIGTQTDASLDAPHQHHEGHGGWRIDQLEDNLLGLNKVDDSAHGGYWLTGGHGTGRGAIHPQFVTVMAGINDIDSFIGSEKSNPMSGRSDVVLTTIEGRLTKLVDTLTGNLPDATILLGGCIPFNNGLLSERLTGATASHRQQWAQQDGVGEQQELGVNHWVILFDRWISQTYVPKLQAEGKRVAFVDLYADFILPDGSVRSWSNQPPQNTDGPAGYGDYGLHPNAFGYRLIGQSWADAIHSRLAAAPGNP